MAAQSSNLLIPPPSGFILDLDATGTRGATLPPPPSGFVPDPPAASPHPDILGQFAAQVQPSMDADARNAALTEIEARETGMRLAPSAPAADGSQTWSKVKVGEPKKLDDSEKQAIFAAFLAERAGRQIGSSTGGQSFQQMQQQVQGATLADNTALQNFGGAFGQTMAQTGTGLLGVVAPETANELNQNVREGYSVDYDTKAALAGQIVGNTLPVAAGVATGGAAIVPALLGASQFGQVRADIAQRRLNGEQISTEQELGLAATTALAEFAGERIGLGAITKAAPAVKNAIIRSVLSYAEAAGINASEEAVTQILQNVAESAILQDRNADVGEGVGTAAFMGGVIGAGGRGLNQVINRVDTNAPVADVPPTDAMSVAVESERPAVTPHGSATDSSAQPASMPVAESRPVPAELPPLLDGAVPKARVTDGGVGRAVELDFASPLDKALYIASQPRQGKLQVDARRYLELQGMDAGTIPTAAQQLRARVDTLTQTSPGETVTIPAAPVAAVDPLDAFAGATFEDADTSAPADLPRGGIEQLTPAPNRQADEAEVARFKSAVLDTDFTKLPANMREATARRAATSQALPVAAVNNTDASYLPEKRQPADVPRALAVAGKEIKGFTRIPPANAQHAQAADAFRKRGVQLIFYRGEGRGVRLAGQDGVLFVNQKNVDGDLHEAVAHEFMHELRANRPGLFYEFFNAMPKELFASERAEYERMWAKFRPGETLSPSKLDEEAVTLAFGKLSQNPRVWQAALGRNPTLMQQIVDFLREFAAKFSSKSKMVQTAIKAFEDTLSQPIGPVPSEQSRGVSGESATVVREPVKGTRHQPVAVTTPQDRFEVTDPGDIAFLPTKTVDERGVVVDNIRVGLPSRPGFNVRLKNALTGSGSIAYAAAPFDRLRKSVQDSLWPVIKATRSAMSGNAVAPDENPELLLRLLAGVQGSIGEQRKSGMMDATGKVIKDKVTKLPLNEEFLYSAGDTSSPDALRDSLTDAMRLGVAQRTIEKAGQLGRSSGVSGLADSASDDVAEARRIIADLSADPAKLKRSEEILRRYRAFADHVLQFAVDTGYVSAEDAAAMRSANGYYINMGRVMDGEGIKVDVRPGSVFKAFRGGGQAIDDPIVNLLASSDRIVKAAMRNQAYAAFVRVASTDPAILRPAKKGDESTITVRLDGVEGRFAVPPDIKEALDTYGEYVPEFLNGVLNIPGRTVRKLVTIAPAFRVRNLIRDTVDRNIKSDSGVAATFRRVTGEEAADFRRAGGDQGGIERESGREDYERRQQQLIRRLTGQKDSLLMLPRKAAAAWEHLGSAGENRTRHVEFAAAKERALSQGMNEYQANLYAAGQARGLVDFAVAGSAIRKINSVMYIPFLNAGIQGVTSDLAAARRNPTGYAARVALFSILPSLLEYAWHMGQGEEDEKRWRNLPAWRRDFFWNFRVGDVWITIPKPFTAGLAGSGVNRAIDAVRGKDDAFRGFGGSLARGILPTDETAIIGPLKPVVEVLTNHSFFFGRNIVPPWERKLALELRNTRSASGLGKFVSSALKSAGLEFDPRYVDTLVSGFSGGTGQLAMSVSDLGSGKPGAGADDLLRKASGLSTVSPGRQSVAISRALETAAKFGDERVNEAAKINALLGASAQAESLAERDRILDEANETAARLSSFYSAVGDTLTTYKQTVNRANAAEREWESVQPSGRSSWRQAHPEKFALAKASDRFERAGRYLAELRGRYIAAKDDQSRKTIAARTNMLLKQWASEPR